MVRHEPLPVLITDGAQLTLVFQNLIGNAIKFRGAEAPEIHISTEATAKEWHLRGEGQRDWDCAGACRR